MTNPQSLEERIRIIENRNDRVEAEKAWEVSVIRRGLITLVTYVIALLTFVSIGSLRPHLDALIPTLGYVLSTQSLPFLKRWWMKERK